MVIIIILDFSLLDSEIKASSKRSLLFGKNFLYRVCICPHRFPDEIHVNTHLSKEPLACPFLNYKHSSAGFKMVRLFREGRNIENMPFLLFLKFRDLLWNVSHISLLTGSWDHLLIQSSCAFCTHNWPLPFCHVDFGNVIFVLDHGIKAIARLGLNSWRQN